LQSHNQGTGLALEARTVCALDGYLFEHGEFSASFAKDDRIMTGLKVTARSRLLPLPLEHRNGPDLIIVPIVVSPSACAVFISPIMVTPPIIAVFEQSSVFAGMRQRWQN
jgi:hypothetical protein